MSRPASRLLGARLRRGWAVLALAGWLLFFMSVSAVAHSPPAADSPAQRSPARWFGEDGFGAAAALGEADEDNPFAPGLIATFRGANGAEHVRLVDGLSHVWNERSPDGRLPAGPFSVVFSGRLWIQTPGVYKLRVYAAGQVRLKIGEQTLLDGASTKPDWLVADPVELPFGFHPLTVEYARTEEPARIGLFWEGPNFGFEPVASRWLLHERELAPSADFEHGELLVRGLRCAACHALPGEERTLAAPSLASLGGNVSRAWLVDWLATHDARHAESAARRMPHFDVSRAEAEAMADALLTASEPLPAAKVEPREKQAPGNQANKKDKKNKKKDDEPPPSAEEGATLFRSIGCLACHRAGELGTAGLFGGGDLSQVAGKRPADFFEAWLAEPRRLNRDHRMPVFPLTGEQRKSLSLYLQTLGTPADAVAQQAAESVTVDESALDGAELIREANCAACHALPQSLAAQVADAAEKPRKLVLSKESLLREEGTCLDGLDRAKRRPGYELSADYRRAIRTYLTEAVPADDARPPSGADLIVEQNCLACHARGSAAGLARMLPAVAEFDGALAAVLPALQPPALHGIGDKLADEALAESLSAPDPPRRPWLRVRMPRFRLTPDERAVIVAEFVATDRIPERPDATLLAHDAELSPPALDAAGPRLVTADGFGCTSCHAIGKWEPEKVALNAHGTALSNIGRRVRREWFDRWVRNPARIVPQMEMPSVQQPVRGVLEGRLDDQLAAVWRVLNRPDFTPPSPSALRVVRRANLSEISEPAAVMTDVIEVGGKGFIKPLVIGLDNRHNVLVDLATARLAAWWIGDAGRQQTRGKTWFWEAGMPQLLPVDSDDDAASDLAIVASDRTIHAERAGQFVTELDTLKHLPRGLKVNYRLRFPTEGAEPRGIRVSETFRPLEKDSPRTGFRRQLSMEGAPPNSQWRLTILPRQAQIGAGGQAATLGGPRGSVEVHLATDDRSIVLAAAEQGIAARFEADAEGRAGLALEYRSEATPDEFPPLPMVDRTLERQELAVVPGYEAIRLPTTDEVMPTAMAWGDDGTLYIASLEGRIWRGRDSDGDELVDKLEPFADDLAAPYGIQVVESGKRNVVDVVNKYSLLRLSDEDGDGRAERTETIASGWGHTRDYHDWAVGLPRDGEGNYYVALPCEQDRRSEAAAYLRGRALKLTPREPTPDDPRRYRLEEFCAGLRFPQGLALLPGGELFATDNQGNYNPFNELNHLRPGKRYGFINSLEAKRGLNPPFESPAIEIPHPWTRSVNGLGHAPPPFAGDLIGCEYDTRRLVRMSLERVAGEFQGAVYPFSREPVGDEPTFEGPLSCSTGPGGDLYIGNIRDSGWGAGSNTGSIVRLRYRGEPAAGIDRVEALADGFRIRFTRPVDREAAANPASYSIVSYRRISTPAYGGDDVDRRAEKNKTVRLADDGQSVDILLDELREGFVYEFHTRNLAAGGGEFFPAEAYYTLRQRISRE